LEADRPEGSAKAVACDCKGAGDLDHKSASCVALDYLSEVGFSGLNGLQQRADDALGLTKHASIASKR
jgi:hypothetical protein